MGFDSLETWQAFLSDPQPSAYAALEQEERRLRVHQVLRKLIRLERQCLLMRSHGHTFREVAAALDIKRPSLSPRPTPTIASFPLIHSSTSRPLQAADPGARPHLLRVETRAGHGTGKPTDKTIEEVADMWAFAAHWTGLKVGDGQ